MNRSLLSKPLRRALVSLFVTTRFFRRGVGSVVFVVYCLSMFSALSQAEPLTSERCITSPNRVKACPNLIYRGVTDPKDKKEKIICICQTDIDRLLNTDVNDRDRILNQMEWRELLAAYGYNERQMKELIKR